MTLNLNKNCIPCCTCGEFPTIDLQGEVMGTMIVIYAVDIYCETAACKPRNSCTTYTNEIEAVGNWNYRN